MLAAFGPDYTWNYETGVKSEWLNHHLLLNVSAYHIDWHYMQYSGVLNCSGKCAHSNGMEFEVSAKPMPGLDLNLATSFMKAELNQKLAAANGSPNSGTQLTNTPEFTLAASANYNWNVGANLLAKAHVDLQHVGEIANMSYRETLNIPGPAYTLFNASLSVGDERWDVKLFGRNLGNTKAMSTITNDTVTPAWVYVNGPRTIGLEVTLKTR